MDPPLDNDRHLRYWKRCLRSYLPHQYTSNDSTRMTLGCFIVAAIDLLSTSSSSSSILDSSDRRALRAWVLACQHPGGGFAGSPTHVLPRANSNFYDGFDFESGWPKTGARAEANIAATLFALQLLALLGDGDATSGSSSNSGMSCFSGVDRNATLRWLKRLQRPNGSFGEVLADVVAGRPVEGQQKEKRTIVAGGSDMRYCYIAAMVRWILRGNDAEVGGKGGESASPAWVDDIDVDALVAYIRRGQKYDGGFAESDMHESHAGYAFCAIAALSLLQRDDEKSDAIDRGIPDRPALVRWLATRQLASPSEEEDDDDEENDGNHDKSPKDRNNPPRLEIGFNGRCNKPADTCYTWWVAGGLHMLGRPAADILPTAPSRRFLLQRTQHIIGGFAKTPGGPPDLYHSYLGLAALATLGEPGLKAFDPALCVSCDAVRKMEAGRRALILAATTEHRRAETQTLLKMATLCWGGINNKGVDVRS